MRRREFVGRMFVDLHVAKALEGPWETLTVQVNTGADDSILPRPILKKLGIPVISREGFELANGRRIVRDVGVVFLRLRDEVGATRVLFGARRDGPVLGNIALEELSLEVEPKTGDIRKARRLLVSARRPAMAA